MRIAFLDFDGVLNHLREPQQIADATAPRLDRFHLDVLKLIIERTNCFFVMCSSWRLPPHIEEKPLTWHNRRLESLGVPGRFIDTTRPWKSDPLEPRHLQISDWLKLHGPVSYVVIDDQDQAGIGHPWIKPSPEIGLVPGEIPIIMQMFAEQEK